MKKTLIIVGIVLVVVFIIYRMFAGSYNNMVEKQEVTSQAWAQVQNVYQRRMDLISNLVETVKGQVKGEKETFEAIQNARSRATQITVDPDKLTPEQVAKFQSAQGELSQALGRLMMVSENYPNLRQSEGFADLRAELAGTENRIAVERMKFNEVVMDYNKYIRQFPNNFFAGMYGFSTKGYFEADAAAQKAPSVKF